MKTFAVSRFACVPFIVVGIAVSYLSQVASAVEVSASSNAAVGPTNHMALPVPIGLFDPGLADFGLAGLAAPGTGTNSDTVSFAYPANAPNAANAVQMYGDAISSITNLGSGAFQLDVTLTNFWMNQGSPLPTKEYVYLNAWETFTNLGLPSNLTWSTSGNISVNGSWAAGPGRSVAIEPIAIVYDPSFTSWTNASAFFGATGLGPGTGPLVGSTAVSSLVPYVVGGQLTVGMQAILLMNDPPGAGGTSIHLPTSLHLSITMTPVPVPEANGLALATLAFLGVGCWRGCRSRKVKSTGKTPD